MRIVFFVHSVLADWNNGHAHFLRGVCSELAEAGHDVLVCEPLDAWSLENMVRDHGPSTLDGVRRAYPRLSVMRYDPHGFDPARAVAGADLVVVHEWNPPGLVADVGAMRRRSSFRLLFHDAHHRAASEPETMARYDLRHYDGALVFGRVLADLYRRNGWVRRSWVWHEAADVRRFRPRPGVRPTRDVVWIGNWGDEERTAELFEFLIEPVRELGLSATVHGVRYPESAKRALAEAGIEYRGWLPNHRVPDVFARHRATLHVPRRPYVEVLPGIPTIRPFEALSCGIPLVSTLWQDVEGLFTPGHDFLVAQDGCEMRRHLQALLRNSGRRRMLARHGLATVAERHTCAHRAQELLAVHRELAAGSRATEIHA